MSFERALLALALTALAAACATPDYRAAPRPGAVGYTDTRLEADRFRVAYRGPSGAGPAEAAQLALRRAAELTLESGAEWFVVDRESRDPAQPSTPGRVSVGVGGGSGRFGGGVGGGVGLDLSPRPGAQVDLLIRVGRGPRPAGAYEAATVLAQDASQSSR